MISGEFTKALSRCPEVLILTGPPKFIDVQIRITQGSPWPEGLALQRVSSLPKACLMRGSGLCWT